MDEDGLSAARDDADDEPASDPDHDAESNASAETAGTPAEERTSDETLEGSEATSGESGSVDADGGEEATGGEQPTDNEAGDRPTGGDVDDGPTSGEANDDRPSNDDREDEAEVETESSSMPSVPDTEPEASDVPEDVQKYARFKKMDGAQYDRVYKIVSRGARTACAGVPGPARQHALCHKRLFQVSERQPCRSAAVVGGASSRRPSWRPDIW